MSYLVDTNILLRPCDSSSSEHHVCRTALSELLRKGETCHCCAQTLIEFWVVATRPQEVNGLGFSPADALANLMDLQRFLSCLPEPPDMAFRWQTIVAEHEVRGRKAHDARLVAFMGAHRLSSILTLNVADFARYPDIESIRPEQILRSVE